MESKMGLTETLIDNQQKQIWSLKEELSKLKAELEEMNKNCISLFLHDQRMHVLETQRDTFKTNLDIVRESHKRQGELNDRVHAELGKALKIVEFYGDPLNWHPYQDKTNGEIWDNDSEWVRDDNGASAYLPGMKARAYLAERKKK